MSERDLGKELMLVLDVLGLKANELCTLAEISNNFIIHPADLSKLKKPKKESYEKRIKVLRPDLENFFSSIIANPNKFKKEWKKHSRENKASSEAKEEGVITNKDLKNLIGSYICMFWNDQTNSIRRHKLIIDYPYENPSGHKDLERALVKYKLEDANYEFAGDARMFGNTVYFRLESESDGFCFSCKWNQANAKNIVYECIGIGTDKSSEKPRAFRLVLINEAWTSSFDWVGRASDFLEAESKRLNIRSDVGYFTQESFERWHNRHHKRNELLRILNGKMYFSYNMLSTKHDRIFQRAWRFDWEGGELKVVREGRKSQKRIGKCYLMSGSTACVELYSQDQAEDWQKKKRFYLFEFDDSVNATSKILMIGLGLGDLKEPLAGREILLEETYDEGHQFSKWQSMIKECSFEELMGSDDLKEDVIGYLVSNETSVLKIRSNYQHTTGGISGVYHVYYINGRGNLVRNKALIQEVDDGVFFDYRGVKRIFKTIHVTCKERAVFIALKDVENQSYFCIHLRYVAGQADGERFLVGTSSAISTTNEDLPISQATVFLESDESFDEIECLEFRGVHKSKMVDRDQRILKYLELHFSNPIITTPIEQGKISEAIIKLKNDLIESFSDLLKRYFDSGEADNPSIYLIKEVTSLLKQLIEEGQISLQSDYKSVYRLFYASFLRGLAKSTKVLSTSYLSETYFWRQRHIPGSVEDFMSEFKREKEGEIARVFILEKQDLDDLDEVESTILLTHFDIYGYIDDPAMGVFYLRRDQKEHFKKEHPIVDLDNTFTLESQHRSYWKVFALKNKSIPRMEIKFDFQDYDRQEDYFERIRAFSRKMTISDYTFLKKKWGKRQNET